MAEEHKDSNTPLSDMGLFRHTSKFIHSEQDNRELTAYQTGGNKLSKFPKVKASNAYNLTQTEDAYNLPVKYSNQRTSSVSIQEGTKFLMLLLRL